MRAVKRLYARDRAPAYMKSSIDLTLPDVKRVRLNSTMERKDIEDTIDLGA